MKIEDKTVKEETRVLVGVDRKVFLENGDTLEDGLRQFTKENLPCGAGAPYDMRQAGLGLEAGNLVIGWIFFPGFHNMVDKIGKAGTVIVARKDVYDRGLKKLIPGDAIYYRGYTGETDEDTEIKGDIDPWYTGPGNKFREWRDSD